MKSFLERHKKGLSISLSIVSSVFLVALVVSAATTIGANITTGGTITAGGVIKSDTTNTDDLGSYTVAWKNIYSSGTVYADTLVAEQGINASGTMNIDGLAIFGDDVRSDTNNTDDLGTSAVAWANVYTSGTVYAETIKAHAAMALGGGDETVAINSSDWDISTTGVMTGIGNITTNGTLTVGGVIASDTTNTDDLGSYTVAWKDIYSSGTVYADYGSFEQTMDVGGGSASTTIRAGADATSTISSSVIIEEASATGTLQLGDVTTASEGGCIVMASGDGSSVLYLFPMTAGGDLYLATSTNASDCY